MPLEKSAGAVIFRKERDTIKYLLLHYDLGHWDLPKGHIEKGEKPEEAAKREVEEETGIKDIEFTPGFKETIKYFYLPALPAGQAGGRRVKVLKTVVFFLAETRAKKIKISYEHEDFKWLSYEKALKQLTFQNAKDILKKADNFLKHKATF